MTSIESHKRVNQILLEPLERPALHWLAGHMPRWVTPDVLTVVGLLGSFTIFAGYALTRLSPAFIWLASFGYVVNWFGDSLDGTVARYRHIERPLYGFLVDHIVDALTATLIFLGFGLSPYMRFDIACLILIAYQLVTIQIGLRMNVSGEFKISYGRIGPTELRLMAIALNTLIFFKGSPPFPWYRQGAFSTGDVVGLVIAAAFLIAYVVQSLRLILPFRRAGK